jgi:Sigma-70 factor, region 1.1
VTRRTAVGADHDAPLPWEGLIARGKEDGCVTLRQILDVFDELEQIPPADLAALFARLNEIGIEVLGIEGVNG